MSIYTQEFRARGVSVLTGYKVEMLKELCEDLRLTVIATKKHGRIVRADYIKTLQDVVAPVGIQQVVSCVCI